MKAYGEVRKDPHADNRVQARALSKCQIALARSIGQLTNMAAHLCAAARALRIAVSVQPAQAAESAFFKCTPSSFVGFLGSMLGQYGTDEPVRFECHTCWFDELLRQLLDVCWIQPPEQKYLIFLLTMVISPRTNGHF